MQDRDGDAYDGDTFVFTTDEAGAPSSEPDEDVYRIPEKEPESPLGYASEEDKDDVDVGGADDDDRDDRDEDEDEDLGYQPLHPEDMSPASFGDGPYDEDEEVDGDGDTISAIFIVLWAMGLVLVVVTLHMAITNNLNTRTRMAAAMSGVSVTNLFTRYWWLTGAFLAMATMLFAVYTGIVSNYRNPWPYIALPFVAGTAIVIWGFWQWFTLREVWHANNCDFPLNLASDPKVWCQVCPYYHNITDIWYCRFTASTGDQLPLSALDDARIRPQFLTTLYIIYFLCTVLLILGLLSMVQFTRFWYEPAKAYFQGNSKARRYRQSQISNGDDDQEDKDDPSRTYGRRIGSKPISYRSHRKNPDTLQWTVLWAGRLMERTIEKASEMYAKNIVWNRTKVYKKKRH